MGVGGSYTHPRIFDRFWSGTQPSVGDSLQVIVAAVAPVVLVGAVAVGVWASGAAALGPSSGVTSLRDFGVSRDLSLDDLVGSKQN